MHHRMITEHQKPDLIEVIGAEGVVLRKRGKNYWALCPFHSEDTPSFKVDADKHSFYCFGCNEHGDVITFIQKYKHLSFKDALCYLGFTNGKPNIDARTQRKRDLVKQFRQWCYDYHDLLSDLIRTLNEAKMRCKTEEDVDRLTPYYHQESVWEWRIAILESRNDAAKLELYREVASEC